MATFEWETRQVAYTVICLRTCGNEFTLLKHKRKKCDVTGDGKEGEILLVFSFMAAPAGPMQPPGLVFTSGVGYPSAQSQRKTPAVYQSAQPVQQAVVPPLPTFSEDDYKQVNKTISIAVQCSLLKVKNF